MEGFTESIASRSMKLNQLILGRCNLNIPQPHLTNRDTLLDALMALYDECNNEHLRKDKQVSMFVEKFRSVTREIKRLRVNITDFEVKKIIGRGHFGEVQVVRDKQAGDVYAMKVLRKGETLSQQNVAFYEEERDIMVKAASPWITRLQYAFQDQLNLYLVMEFHPGGDLLSLLDRHDNMLSEDMVKFYLAELVLAIRSLHTMGYVHRDIKPDNILIDRIGHIKLADFGSAAKLSEHNTVTSRMPVGTPDYIAPEVLLAMNGGPSSSTEYGVECDWWSLGIVAYEMLYGATPFTDDKVVATYSNIMNFKKSLTFPDEPDISVSARDLIKRLLKESSLRLGYSELCEHEFFVDVDWNNMLQTVPPFVPNISSQDDTSNFDEFEHEAIRPSGVELMKNKEFGGKNLPFVGFTYTRCVSSQVDRSGFLEGSFCSPVKSVNTEDSKKELHLLQQELCSLKSKESEHQELIVQLKLQLEHKDNQHHTVEEERDSLQKDLVQLESEVKTIKRLLEVERQDRSITEKKAMELMKAFKQKSKEREEMLLEEIKKNLEKEKERNNDLENQLSCSQEQLKLKANEIGEFQLEVEQLKNQIKKDETVKKTQESDLTVVKKTLEDLCVKFEIEKKAKNEAQEQVVGLKNAMIRLESDWTTKQGLIQQMGQGEGATVVMGSSEVRKRESNEQQKELQKLQSEFEEEKNLRSELELKISQLENELKTAKSETERKGEDWRFKELKFQQMIRKLEEELQHSKSMKLKLEKELQNMELKEKELNNVITNLQKTVKNLEENVEKLEYQKDQFKKNLDSLKGQTIEYTKSCSSDLKQENAFLTTKIEQTESQLERVRENLAKEKASQKELREQLRKKQDELSEIKMDVRISRREAKQAEDIVSTLRDSNRQLREKSITLEKEKNEWHDQEKTLQEKITQLEADLQTKEKTLDEQKNAFKTEKAKLEERIKALRENCGTTKELEEKYAKSQGKYEELSNQIQLLKDQVSAKEHEKEQSVKGYNEIKQQLAEEKKKIKSLEANITLLKSTCTSLEDQLKDYDVVTDTQEETIAKLEREKATLKKDIQCIEEEMKNLELSLSREKKARLENEHKLLELEEEQETNQAIWKAKIETAQEQLAYQREVSSQLSEQVSELERQLATQSQSLKQFHQKVTSLEEDNIQVKEEAAKHITQISSLKASNLKLTQGLEEALEKVNQSKDQIEELYNTAEITKVSHEHEKIKLQETIAQQTKLIDFLQAKVQGLEKKKKRFFGNKGRETGSSTIPLQWRELEGMLERERAKCRRLQEQLDKSRAEVMACKAETGHISKTHGDLENTSHLSVIPTSPKSRAVLSALALSPDVNINNSTDSPTTFITKETASTYRKPQGQRMHHNIPHRFQEVLTMRGTKCAACLDSIHFGRIASRCLECGVTCHTKCSTSLPSTCCLPSGYVQHFTDTLQKKNSNNSQHRPSLKVTFADNNSEEAADITQGWVKLPRSGKQGWEKHYLRLENRTLYILDKENIQSISATDSINLCPADGEVLVTSAVSATDLIGTAKTDLPYVLKIESFPHTTCWPPRCLYIMVPSFAEKQMWVSALESVVKTNEKAKDEELLGSSILHLEGENRLDINCTCHLNDNIILVGAMEGLYTVDILAEPTHSLQTKIDGVPSVYQVAVLETLNTVLLIIGEERKLKMLDLTTLNRWVKGDKMTINEEMTAFQPVSEIEACHLFGTSEDTSSVCAATSSTVFLLKWNVGLHTFCLRKEIKTAEPCSCIHFTTNSVIFGAEKFFELDLKDHSVEEFLDVSDTSLAFLAYGASQLRSFPVAILQVASEECLLCFHELGVFVDSFGKRSRKEDMKWTRLPLAFAYRAPYLFVIHFNSVEVVEIRPQQSTEMGAHTFLEVANPRYLGPAMFIGSVYISSSHDNQMEILCVQGKLTALSGQDVTDTVVRNSSSDSSSSEESDGTEFSFTPSVIQSLDANLSELSEVSSSASLP